MTRDEHLFVIAMEECDELSQRLSKALRFGMHEIQPEQPLTNRQRITEEYTDLVALMEMLDILPPLAIDKDKKKAKVMKYLRYSAVCGTLSAPSSPQEEQ